MGYAQGSTLASAKTFKTQAAAQRYLDKHRNAVYGLNDDAVVLQR
jgi:hypothetical protein